jgi:hypothetical protein
MDGGCRPVQDLWRIAVKPCDAVAAAAAWLAYIAAIIVLPVLVARARIKRRKRK